MPGSISMHAGGVAARPLTVNDIKELLPVLQAALSTDSSVQKQAEALLASLEQRTGYCSCLTVSWHARSLAVLLQNPICNSMGWKMDCAWLLTTAQQAVNCINNPGLLGGNW